MDSNERNSQFVLGGGIIEVETSSFGQAKWHEQRFISRVEEAI